MQVVLEARKAVQQMVKSQQTGRNRGRIQASQYFRRNIKILASFSHMKGTKIPPQIDHTLQGAQ